MKTGYTYIRHTFAENKSIYENEYSPNIRHTLAEVFTESSFVCEM